MCATCGNNNCSDCTKISGRSLPSNPCAPNWTGNVYSDFAFACANDPSLDVALKDQLNKTLTTILTRLCQQTTPEIYASQEIQEDFSEEYAPVTGVQATILEDGDYSIDAVLNYQHGLIHVQEEDNVISWCQGQMTLMKGAVAITDVPGLIKQLEDECTGNQTAHNPKRVASLIHYMPLVKGDVISIGIQSTNAFRKFVSIGGQIRVRRVIKWVDQTSD